jgi:AbrB family looped-hinge helix DNA binding protein
MSTTKVQSRGQITLPRHVRRAAGIKPGDTVVIRVVGPSRLELEIERPMTLEEAFDRWEPVLPVPEWDAARDEAEAELADEFVRKETKPHRAP